MDIHVVFEALSLTNDPEGKRVPTFENVLLGDARDCFLAGDILWKLRDAFVWRKFKWKPCLDNNDDYTIGIEVLSRLSKKTPLRRAYRSIPPTR